jgi:hypothetical protein
MLKGPVPGFFGLIGKTASGKLPTLQMIAQAFTTESFAGTGIICAVTTIEILFFSAFHLRRLHYQNWYFIRLSQTWKTKMIKAVLPKSI